ncbi:MAG: UvrD/REP helicase [Bradyrhizobium sp.]|nr:UvrD/REP helicase [Bradyrhizobium sp.]
MDASELGRQRAAELHDLAVARGLDPRDPYAFAVAEAKNRDLDVEPATPGAAILDGGRASFVAADNLIVHENIGSDFDRAFLVAHEIGHCELGDNVGTTLHEVDPARPAEPSPVGFDRVVDYGRRQRREVQMDLFARELLLPRHVVRRMHVEQGLSASHIAELMRAPFDVVAQQLLDALLLPTIVPQPERPHIARPLNPLQAVAAAHREKPYLLEAGPGTGKTQTLTGRIEGLLAEQVDPRRILVLTFSNKAAGEMAVRIARTRPEAAAAMWIGTFHAFGLDLVRRFSTELNLPADPRMMDRTEAVELLEREFPKIALRHYRNLYDPTRNIADILSAISRAKDEVVDADDYARLAREMRNGADDPARLELAEKADEVARVYACYESLKRKAHCIDFGDLVSLPVRLLETNEEARGLLQRTYDHVLVDEYQDVNRSSVRLLEALCPNGKNLWVVGDAKQSIYRFRGASSFNTARFGVEDFKGADKGRLELNYRSYEEITDAFSAFAAGMKVAGTAAGLTAARGTGGARAELRTVTGIDEQSVAIADAIEEMRGAGHAYRGQAVLCTGNERLSSIGLDLERLGIPVLFLGSLFERPEVKDLLCLLSLLVDGRAMGLARVACMPPFRMSLADVAAVLDGLRDQDLAGDEWLPAARAMPLTNTAVAALDRLAGALADFDETDPPWKVLATLLLDRTSIAAEIAQAGAIADRTRGIAIWQFMNFLRVQPAGAGLPVRRLLDRVRRLVRIGDDRDLRQLPLAAQGLDAVRLMTIHGAKGLEFPVVHLPGMNQDTLPGNPKTPPCLPPDGMIAGGEGDALAVFRTGDAEERECLFYVAASRAEDRLFLYAVTHNAAGSRRPLSPFLDRIGDNLVRRHTTPTRLLPPAPEAAGVALEIDGPLRFSGAQIALFETCARRFFYTHILRLGGKRTETDYMRLHEAARSIVSATVSAGFDIDDDAVLAARVAEACAHQGLEPEGALVELQAMAVDMIRYFRTSRSGRTPERPQAIRLTIDNEEILFRPDDVLVAPDGARSFRRVRTGHIRSTETKDVGAAVFLLAARGADPAAIVELVHLSDEAVTPLDLSPTVLRNRQKTLSGMLAGIRAGTFPPKRSERTCPNCPAFFVCGEIPSGPLPKKF